MEHIIVVTSLDGVHTAGPVREPDENTTCQDLHEDVVTVPSAVADYAFDWASDDAVDGYDEYGHHSQVWHVVDGIVTDYFSTYSLT